MTAPKVSVHYNKIAKAWTVSCTACEPWPVALMLPWAVTENGSTARVLALWHVAEHQRESCTSCGSVPPILKPVVDPNHRDTFHIGHRLFRMAPHGVIELVPTPTEA